MLSSPFVKNERDGNSTSCHFQDRELTHSENTLIAMCTQSICPQGNGSSLSHCCKCMDGDGCGLRVTLRISSEREESSALSEKGPRPPIADEAIEQICVNLVPHFHALTSHVLIYVVPDCHTRANCHCRRQKKKRWCDVMTHLGRLLLLQWVSSHVSSPPTHQHNDMHTVPVLVQYHAMWQTKSQFGWE